MEWKKREKVYNTIHQHLGQQRTQLARILQSIQNNEIKSFYIWVKVSELFSGRTGEDILQIIVRTMKKGNDNQSQNCEIHKLCNNEDLHI